MRCAGYGRIWRGIARRRSLVSWRAGDCTYDLELAYAVRLKPLERQYREPFWFVAPLRQHCLPAALPSTLGLSQYNPHPSS
ncbi:hypothetical protein M422DRAFT_272505 [Sphaerobolus stellatus SS14]|uniref:Uncharacterized protein n=1 Tax=Sphaerobolus stellatus (strain SS14) TaxID=990650 RepID=A0A0C9TXA1_SPHS4|nr:hypothetical protein M422DRAFT_272505 [Sphaerobolus stellatus SS14]